MNYSAILGQAWQFTIRYRAFWLFGFLLALFGGNGGQVNLFDYLGNVGMIEGLPDLVTVPILMTLAGVGLSWVLAGVVIKAVTRTAIIGMSQQVRDTGTVAMRDGWRRGWTRQAWQVFLIDLLLRSGAGLLFVLALAVALLPLALLLVDIPAIRLLAGVASLNFVCLWFIFLTLFSVFVTPFIEISQRFIVLSKFGIRRAIQFSYHLFRNKGRDLLSGILLMLGLTLVWRFASAILGAIFGMTLFMLPLLSLGAGEAGNDPLTAWLIAGGLLTVGLPMLLIYLFATGLFLIFQLSFWTLVFYEINLTAY